MSLNQRVTAEFSTCTPSAPPTADLSIQTLRPEQSDPLHTEHGEVCADVDTTPSGDAEGRANPRARISAS
jgi:hypothetical protein